MELLAEGDIWLHGIWDWVLSVGLFAAVALLVMTLFGHAGEIHLSPQREAAIATGHTQGCRCLRDMYPGRCAGCFIGF